MAMKEQLNCCERQVLAEAALGGHAGAARLLLAAGADPDRRSETQGATVTPRSPVRRKRSSVNITE